MATYSDDFNRTELGADWTEIDTEGDNWDIDNNEVRGAVGNSGSFPATLRFNNDQDSDDHWAQIEFTQQESTSSIMMPCVRFASDGSETCYFARVRDANNDRMIQKVVDGTHTVLNDFGSGGGAVRTTRLEADGSTLTLYDESGTVASPAEVGNITDTSISGNLRTGLAAHSSSVNTSWGDNFQAEDLSTGVTASVGQAVETDTAQPVSAAKATSVGQAVESSTSQPVTAERTHAVGQAAETSTAQPVSTAKTATIGQASETSTAQPVSTGTTTTVAVGQASETSTAQPITAAKTAGIGQATEQSAARSVTARRTHTIGQASTTATARAVTHARTVTVGQASTLATAQAVSTLKRMAIGQAVETDTAQPVSSTVGESAVTALTASGQYVSLTASGKRASLTATGKHVTLTATGSI